MINKPNLWTRVRRVFFGRTSDEIKTHQRLWMLEEMLLNFNKYFPEGLFSIESWRSPAFFCEGQCGTIGCALGWAAVWPPFVHLGLKSGIVGLPTYNTHEGYEAGMVFFGISMPEATRIFSPMEYRNSNMVTPEMVAERVKEVMENY